MWWGLHTFYFDLVFSSFVSIYNVITFWKVHFGPCPNTLGDIKCIHFACMLTYTTYLHFDLVCNMASNFFKKLIYFTLVPPTLSGQEFYLKLTSLLSC